MSALSDYLENKIIDWFRGQAFPAVPSNLHVALFTTNENDANSGAVEVTGGAYARVSVAASMAAWAGTQGAGTTVASTGSSGTTSNNGTITFPVPTANWGSITGMAVFDAPTGGNLLFFAPLTTAKTVNNGDPTPSFAAGALTFQADS
jgi:hypothetical protein